MRRINLVNQFIFSYCLVLYLAILVLSIQLDADLVLLIFGFLLVVILFNFIDKLGKTFPFIDLIPMLALGLWIIMPVYSYEMQDTALLFYPWMHMPIKFEEYFQISAPATLLLISGIYFPFSAENFNIKEWKERIKVAPKIDQIGIILIGVGIMVTTFGRALPQSISYIAFLLSTCLFTGTFYLFFSDNKLKYLALVLYFVFPVQNTLAQGMFGEFVFWTAFFVLITAAAFKLPFVPKLILVTIGLIGVFFIQALKIDYREAYWFETGDLAGLDAKTIMITIIERSISEYEDFLTEDKVAVFFDRFNQGRRIAYCVEYVPYFEPYANGEPVAKAIVASFIPRFLWPDKPTTGGKETYERFTGRELVGNTSMNISPLGEGYVNFGPFGASIAMFFYGLIICYVNRGLIRYIARDPLIVFWFPLIWLNTVKVETDFVSVLNHLMKSIIFVYIMYFIIYKILGTKRNTY